MASITTRAGKGDTLSFTEMDDNFTNLNTAKLESENAGSTGQILTRTSTGANWADAAAGGIANVVEDTTPQLGGSLDVNGNSIVSTSNGNIELTPNGSGNVYANSMLLRVGTGSLFGGVTSNGAHDLILNTNSGTNSGSIQITDGVNGNISIIPNGTGKVSISGIQYPTVNGTDGQVLTSNGSGAANWATPAGGGWQFASFSPNWDQASKAQPESGIFRIQISSEIDPSNFATLAGDNNSLTLTAGSYLVSFGDGGINTDGGFDTYFRNTSDSANAATFASINLPVTGQKNKTTNTFQFFTITSTKTFEVRANRANFSGTGSRLVLFKIA
jgi:hypothetical protein